ncbi:hypothetical protein BPAE_0026g00260 [Botrytis paeoniae]|uniref:Uncharacterized protein n=1 Tax=Botrytis paeoniae TaxID=278948 RepID=A0A4Z1FV06_9HELO|nr:hypothetical protein BPAE_0026g00260 [Botrytis paeoniae]
MPSRHCKRILDLDIKWHRNHISYGRLLYDVNGFVYVEENINHPQTDTPDEKWKEIDEKVGLFTFWLMRRLPGYRTEVERQEQVVER